MCLGWLVCCYRCLWFTFALVLVLICCFWIVFIYACVLVFSCLFYFVIWFAFFGLFNVCFDCNIVFDVFWSWVCFCYCLDFGLCIVLVYLYLFDWCLGFTCVCCLFYFGCFVGGWFCVCLRFWLLVLFCILLTVRLLYIYFEMFGFDIWRVAWVLLRFVYTLLDCFVLHNCD